MDNRSADSSMKQDCGHCGAKRAERAALRPDQTRAETTPRSVSSGGPGGPLRRAMDPHHAFRPCPLFRGNSPKMLATGHCSRHCSLSRGRRERDWTLWLYCPPRLSQSAPRSLALLSPSIPFLAHSGSGRLARAGRIPAFKSSEAATTITTDPRLSRIGQVNQIHQEYPSNQITSTHHVNKTS